MFQQKKRKKYQILGNICHRDDRIILLGQGMSRWAYLGLAIISEVIATTSLKSTEGFTKFLPSTIVVIGYCAAFYFLSLTLDSIPIGVVYAIWSGAGIVGIAILSWIIYGQNLDLGTGIGMALIIAGIIVMRLYSNVDFA